MTAARFYSSTSGLMDLTSSVGPADTAIVVSSTTGLPGTVPFTLVLDGGTPSEEIVDVTNVSGTTLTVARGVDGSSAQSHSAAVGTVRHMATARDFREPQEHIGSTADVHGVGAGSAVVGTNTVQAFKNKNLTDPSNTFPASLATDAELSAHAALTAAHGATGAVVGTTNTQTLTGKTLSGSSNTFSNIPQSAVTSLTSDQSAQNGRLDALEAVPAWSAVGGFTTGASAGSPAAQYRVWPATGKVELRGRIDASSTFGGGGVAVAVLPSGARPTTGARNFPVARSYSSNNTSDARLTIDSTGTLTLYCPAGETQWISLDGVYFYTV